MKKIRTATQCLFILCLPFLLLTTSVRIAANSSELYRYGFNKYDISRATGIEPAELEKVISGLITYFNNNQEYINLTVVKNGQSFTLFNSREVGHLKDVKGLFRLNFRVLFGTLIYCFLYSIVSISFWRDKRRVSWGLVGGSALTLGLIAAVGLMISVNFEWFFYQFHLISFANDLWQLDPTTDYLIMLFPQGFWYDATLFCTVATAGMAVITGVAGWWRLRKEKREKPPAPVGHPPSLKV